MIRGHRRDDTGMTVMELSVAMLITGVLMAGIGAVVISTFRAVSITNVKTADSADLRIGLEAISRALRVTSQPAGQPAAFATAAADQVSFYTLLNRTGSPSVTQPLPSKVTYTWDSATGCVNQALTPGAVTSVSDSTPTWPAAGTVTVCLLRTPTPPVFSYYVNSTSTTPLATPVTGDALLSIQSVQVNLTARDPNQPRDAGVPAQVRVSLVNIPVPTVAGA